MDPIATASVPAFTSEAARASGYRAAHRMLYGTACSKSPVAMLCHAEAEGDVEAARRAWRWSLRALIVAGLAIETFDDLETELRVALNDARMGKVSEEQA